MDKGKRATTLIELVTQSYFSRMWGLEFQEVMVLSLLVSFAFRWSVVIRGCHYRGSDEDTQGVWVFLLQLFSSLLQMI